MIEEGESELEEFLDDQDEEEEMNQELIIPKGLEGNESQQSDEEFEDMDVFGAKELEQKSKGKKGKKVGFREQQQDEDEENQEEEIF